MDNKERNVIDQMGEMLLNLPVLDSMPASLKLSREIMRYTFKVRAKIREASQSDNEELCAKLYKALLKANDELIAILEGNSAVFKVGQRVQFKTWAEMEAEFGTDNEGSIACYYSFTKNMKGLCGTTATIKEIRNGEVFLTDYENDEVEGWCISMDMLKPVQEV